MAKKASSKPPKGTRDFLPDELLRRRFVMDTIAKVYEAHGFLPLATPSFERLETLLGKYGDEGDQLVFKILRRGQALVKGVRDAASYIEDPSHLIVGRSGETAPGAESLLADNGLRYDLTVPLARVVAEYQGKLPAIFKRYAMQPVWRADNPGKGRFREFYQCDVDVVGSSSLLVEAEVTGAVAQCLTALGFADFEIRLNHRALLRALVEAIGLPLSAETEVIVAIDKLDKVGEAGVLEALAEKQVPEAARARLAELLFGEVDLNRLKAALSDHAGAQAAISELETILALSQATPAAGLLRFSPTLARGLGYYTGAIFEIAVKDLAGSLGGGGRYDHLIGMFLGRDIPACGFSIGLERILVVMEQRGMFKQNLAGIDLLLAVTDKKALPRLLPVAYQLREAGLRVETQLKADSPGKLRQLTEARGLPELAILREDSLEVWRPDAPEERPVPQPIDTFLAERKNR